MTVIDWLARATEDAERRGLTELVPLLQTLARSTEALRAADAEFGHPATATEKATEYAEHTATEYTATEYTEYTATEYTEYTDKDGDDGGKR